MDQSLTRVTVQLNWRHQFEFAAFYAALEQGYYRNAGLDVHILAGGPGIDPVNVVVSQQADFGVANSSLVLEHARGKPVVALAALMQHSAFALLARRDRGIETIGDLDGKRISCAPHACDEIKAYLTASGLHEGHVHYVPTPSAEISESLKVSDATDIFTTNQGFGIRGHENEYLLFTPRSAGIDLYGDILFTTRDRIEQSPATVAAFRKATTEGLKYAFDHQDEVVQLILSRYNEQNKSVAHLNYEAQKLYELIRPDLVEPGYMSLGRWQHVRDVYAGLGMLPADYSVEDMLYQPEPDRWPSWLKRTLAGLGLALTLTLVLSGYLRRINRTLQAEINERTKAEVALQASQDRFQRFVEQANSVVTHELRTLLSVMRVHLDLLELKRAAEESSRPNINAMKQTVLRLEELFEKNLKQIFASTSFFPSRQRVELGLALTSILARPGASLNASRVQLDIPDAPLVLRIAPKMLEAAITNLLENARKYSPPESMIAVTLVQQGADALIEVANTSSVPLPANPGELLEKHARSRANAEQSGSGVGLYLVHLIAEAHGGSASLVLDPPDRVRVQLRMPLAPVSLGDDKLDTVLDITE